MASADAVRIVRDVLGDGAVAAGDALGAFAVDGQIPQCVAYPETSDALSRCAAALHEAGRAVIPAGNGTHLRLGRPPRAYDVALSTRRMRRVVAHEAADLTVTVEAGCTLAELNDVLASAGQILPLDPPHPERRTVGSIIATDAWGPWRLAHGKVRDLLIGVTVVLASGTVVRGGGRVVKNVAGYDLMKLFTGSFGTLGIVVEATFKVRPRPEHTAVLVVPVGGVAAAALRSVLRWWTGRWRRTSWKSSTRPPAHGSGCTGRRSWSGAPGCWRKSRCSTSVCGHCRVSPMCVDSMRRRASGCTQPCGTCQTTRAMGPVVVTAGLRCSGAR